MPSKRLTISPSVMSPGGILATNGTAYQYQLQAN